MLLMLLNNFRNFFMFCINLDIDEVLLLDQKRPRDNSFIELFPFVILEKAF